MGMYFVGFGSFSVRKKAARKGYNPKTRELSIVFYQKDTLSQANLHCIYMSITYVIML